MRLGRLNFFKQCVDCQEQRSHYLIYFQFYLYKICADRLVEITHCSILFNILPKEYSALFSKKKKKNSKREVDRLSLDIVGLSEVRKPQANDLVSKKFRLINLAAEIGQGAIGIIT